MNPLYTAWEVSDEVDDLSEAGQVPEERPGWDLPEKILLPVRSSNKALKEHKNKQLDMPITRLFHKKSDLSTSKQFTGPDLHPTSLDNSRVKSLIPLTQRLFSAACAEPRKEIAFGKNQEISKPAHHLVSAGSMLWPHKSPGLKNGASGKLLNLGHKSAVTRGQQRARSHSGNVFGNETGPVCRRSESLVLSCEGVQARHNCANLQKGVGMTHHRLRDYSWGPEGYCLRLCHTEYWQPVYSGVTQGHALPSTHLYLWARDGRDFSQKASSQFRPFIWKNEGDERGATGPSGHPADSQPDSQAARPKDIRCQSMRQQNPEPQQTEQRQDHDFTLKHILQILQCR
ncbi:hypothetical protein SKAU_G00066850 [Synaphobranchus kaupii]|uniref:Uncharacterized protein n=1 Tax=Synaphobranchus kaupii TaxID=118154 RepID=A0A9Q1G667_SYNKA|nr:hypothetical protein SKAU_G00066850 [Synaphobranchus kaupii]